MGSNDTHASILEIATDTRGVFERVLQSSLNTTEVQGACLYASVLLVVSLRQFAKVQAAVRGGSPDEGCGARDTGGQLRGHYWVEAWVEAWVESDTPTPCGRSEARWVVDITGDQFGHPPVQVIGLSDAKHHAAGDQDRVNRHLLDEGFPQAIAPPRTEASLASGTAAIHAPG